jgi:hypothetical protein
MKLPKPPAMPKKTSCQALTINIVEESKNQKQHPKNNNQHYQRK